jgi:hypothetical protein
MISKPFNASCLTPRRVADPLVDSGFGICVAADCVVAADGSLVDVASAVPQADNKMDRMKVRVSSFFIVVSCHCEEGT